MSGSKCNRVVFLTATELEAGPVLAGMRVSEQVEVAGKKIYLGELGMPRPASGRDSAAELALGGRGYAPEVDGPIPVALMVSGCDKVNAAHGLTCMLQTVCPDPPLVIQVGIAGAFSGPAVDSRGGGGLPGPAVGDVVLAAQEAYSDTGSSSPAGWLSAAEIDLPVANGAEGETFGVFPLDPDLVEIARVAIVERMGGEGSVAVHVGPCVTASLITGTDEEAERLIERWGALAESMEGAAAAHVCLLHRARFLEIRGISNLVGNRDRGAWQLEGAASVAGRAALAAVVGVWEKSSAQGGEQER